MTQAKLNCSLPAAGTAWDTFFDNSTEDSLGAIKSAREQVEHDGDIRLMPQTLVVKYDDWPVGHDQVTGLCTEDYWELPSRPIQPEDGSNKSITIQYLDVNGATQTWARSNYEIDHNDGDWPLVLKVDSDTELPDLQDDKTQRVIVTMECGFANPNITAAAADQRLLVPSTAKQAILLLIAEWFYNREQFGRVSRNVRRSYDSLIKTLRTTRYV